MFWLATEVSDLVSNSWSTLPQELSRMPCWSSYLPKLVEVHLFLLSGDRTLWFNVWLEKSPTTLAWKSEPLDMANTTVTTGIRGTLQLRHLFPELLKKVVVTAKPSDVKNSLGARALAQPHATCPAKPDSGWTALGQACWCIKHFQTWEYHFWFKAAASTLLQAHLPLPRVVTALQEACPVPHLQVSVAATDLTSGSLLKAWCNAFQKVSSAFSHHSPHLLPAAFKLCISEFSWRSGNKGNWPANQWQAFSLFSERDGMEVRSE